MLVVSLTASGAGVCIGPAQADESIQRASIGMEVMQPTIDDKEIDGSVVYKFPEAFAAGDGTALFPTQCVLSLPNPAPTLARHPGGVLTWGLRGGTVLRQGDFCQVGNGLLYMQPDGNLVVYDENYDPGIPGRGALWASDTFGRGHHASFQTDGNFVVYNFFGTALQTGKVPSNTWRIPDPGYALHVQADRNVVIYASGWAPVWSTRTGR